MKNIYKWIDLQSLPKYLDGRNKGNIEWSKTIGARIHFIYGKIDDYFIIKKHINNPPKIIIEYNNYDYEMFMSSFFGCHFNNILNNKNNTYKIGDILKDSKHNITILDSQYRTDNNGRKWKWYKFKCNVCGWNEGWVRKDSLEKTIRCACCSGYTTVEGINDIPTTTPWMIPYFQGGYDEAKLYSYGSNKRIYPICPDCKRIKNKQMKICDIYRMSSIGCSCSDGISYPEKFVMSMFNQLNINYIYQFTNKNIMWCGKYKYDIFWDNNICEIHGKQHYIDCTGYFKSAISLENTVNNDNEKRNLALLNNIKNYIVIDARESNISWIKNSIMNSDLPKLLQFTEKDVNWLKCHENGMKNITKQVCLYYKEVDHNITHISKVFKLSIFTIKKYLRGGSVLNWCDYI